MWWSVVVLVVEGFRVGGGEFPHDGGFSALSRGQLSVLRELSAGRTGSLRGSMNGGADRRAPVPAGGGVADRAASADGQVTTLINFLSAGSGSGRGPASAGGAASRCRGRPVGRPFGLFDDVVFRASQDSLGPQFSREPQLILPGRQVRPPRPDAGLAADGDRPNTPEPSAVVPNHSGRRP